MRYRMVEDNGRTWLIQLFNAKDPDLVSYTINAFLPTNGSRQTIRVEDHKGRLILEEKLKRADWLFQEEAIQKYRRKIPLAFGE